MFNLFKKFFDYNQREIDRLQKKVDSVIMDKYMAIQRKRANLYKADAKFLGAHPKETAPLSAKYSLILEA